MVSRTPVFLRKLPLISLRAKAMYSGVLGGSGSHSLPSGFTTGAWGTTPTGGLAFETIDFTGGITGATGGLGSPSMGATFATGATSALGATLAASGVTGGAAFTLAAACATSLLAKIFLTAP